MDVDFCLTASYPANFVDFELSDTIQRRLAMLMSTVRA